MRKLTHLAIWLIALSTVGMLTVNRTVAKQRVNLMDAGVTITKYTNGADADSPPGPEILVGDPVFWTYEVRNTGDLLLEGIFVLDDQGVDVTCPQTTLEPGQTMVCTGEGVAQAGQYANVGTVVAFGFKERVEASNPSHYFGVRPSPSPSPIPSVSPSPNPSPSPSPQPSTSPSPNPSPSPSPQPSPSPSPQPSPSPSPSPNPGDQGCTPGYWKNHEDSWAATGFSTSQTVQSVFSGASAFPTLGSATLLDALSFSGGPTVTEKAALLLHHATAAVLNAAHPGVAYPRTVAQIISDTNAALATNDGDVMEALKDEFDADNNLGCPLNRGRPRPR